MKNFTYSNVRPIQSCDDKYILLDIRSSKGAASLMLEVCTEEGFYITNQFCHSHMYSVSKVTGSHDEEVIADVLQDFYDDLEQDLAFLFQSSNNEDYAYDMYIDSTINGGL